MLKALGLKKWLGSKKTKSMMLTQLGLVAIAGFIILQADGDPEKVKALFASIKEIVYLLTGTGAVTIGAQGYADKKK